ncbi:MAG TPA: hypothetical protein VEY92_08680 [Pseudoxanthomonas sp.]|nr:hypothetical protein [Pseudoxanthomonas sp.]
MVELRMFCDQAATRLCDNALAMVDAGEVCKQPGAPPHRVTSMEAMLSHSYTCDAPFCDAHGHVVGFVCGVDSDTIDNCMGCYGKSNDGMSLMTPGAIDAMRRQMHAGYRRQRISAAAKSTRVKPQLSKINPPSTAVVTSQGAKSE